MRTLLMITLMTLSLSAIGKELQCANIQGKMRPAGTSIKLVKQYKTCEGKFLKKLVADKKVTYKEIPASKADIAVYAEIKAKKDAKKALKALKAL